MTLTTKILDLAVRHEKRTGESPDIVNIPRSMWHDFAVHCLCDYKTIERTLRMMVGGYPPPHTRFLGMQVRWYGSALCVAHNPTWP